MDIPVVVQYRHAHLSQNDELNLFGHALTPGHSIEQRDQFIARERVSLIGPNGTIENVAVIGPARTKTQVELSATDARALGVNAPLRASGDLNQSAGITIRGSNGEIKSDHCAIIPIRHLHLPTTMAQSLHLSQNDIVSARGKELKFEIRDVLVRIHQTFAPALHLTTDETSQYWLHTNDIITI